MDTLRALADQLAAASAAADPLDRYQDLHALAPALKAALAAEMDAAIAEARDALPEDQVADRAGVTVHEVRRRVTAHRKRTGPPRRPGRPGKSAE
ncbi:hypothetical protein O7630_34675 [Micromonospora sp. WMMD718]|uniref:hypothetical protein n=1 Tax=Micromonospora TaxID=1873 RepID=UPI0004BEC2E2|nr:MULTISPECIES: hypothetical protein [Micromonospora]MBC9001305.1 hypothetical protein [Micromonospora aurantiaca]MDG4756037.1 hypothetical protein [Micromonospora sp. WMMD718]MDG4756091.1 hypothetical protein [Micromonospora sp. WMMD718]